MRWHQSAEDRQSLSAQKRDCPHFQCFNYVQMRIVKMKNDYLNDSNIQYSLVLGGSWGRRAMPSLPNKSQAFALCLQFSWRCEEFNLRS